MSSLSILDRDLCSILADMRAEKVTQRQKAFEKLELILNSREDDILRYMAEKKFDTSWQDVMDAAHHGIQKQNRKVTDSNAAGGMSAEGKNYIYIKVLQGVIDLAMNREEPHIKFADLIKRVTEVLSDSSMLQYFGVCYIQILQKHVLNSKWDITVVTYEEWKAILTRCFELYADGRVTKQVIAGCLRLAVQRGLENCSVQIYLVKFLNPLAQMINECDRGKVLYELIRIAYYCVLNLAVDCRYEICHFTERISQRLIKAYEPKMEEDMKAIIFRLMHLMIVVHNPEKCFNEWRSNQDLEYAVERPEWNKALRNFYFVIGSEIKAHVSASYDAVGGRDVRFVDGFIDFAARLCYVIFWHDEIWLQMDGSDGNDAKRIKRANKLQSLMDLIEVDSNKPNWRWFIILAEIVERCPVVLNEDDYQPLLHLLSSIQPKLQLSSHIKSFRFCCVSLLNYEKDAAFKKSKIINNNLCAELWHKITETCFRCSTSNNKCASDNHFLLRLLVTHHKYPSTTFLNNVLNAFYSYSIDRTNVNIETIGAILETVPLESLGNMQEMVEKLLNYLFPQSRETQAKGILHHKERLDMKLLAGISINFSVTKHKHKDCEQTITELAEPTNRLKTKYFETNEMIRDIEENILLRSMEKLLEVRITQQNSHSLETALSAVTYNIHEANFEMLCGVLNSEKPNLQGKGLMNIICDIELFLVILNDFLVHNAFTKDSFEKCLLTKKLAFKIQEMDLIFESLDPMTVVELNEISTRLLVVFQGPYHAFINQMIKMGNFTNLINWILKNARNLPNNDSKSIEYLEQKNLNKEQLNQHNLLLIVVHYMKYDGLQTNEVKDFLERTEFNIYNNLDVYHIFKMAEVLVDHSSTFFLAEWVLTNVKDMCRAHHTNNSITDAIISLYPKLIVLVSSHDSLFNDTNTVLLSFIRKANKQNYSMNLQRKIYDLVKYLIKAYPDHYESHEAIYTRMATLIASPCFALKMSAVNNLLHLFKDGWAFPVGRVPSDFYRFQLKLYSSVLFEMDDLLNKDEKQCLLSGSVQLVCGTLCSNYYLRKRALLDLVEQISLSQMQPHKVQLLLKSIKEVEVIDPTVTVHNSIDRIFDLWIVKNYKLETFPWYLTDSESFDVFLQKYQNELASAVLCHKPKDIAQFCLAVNKSSPEVMKAIIPKSISYLLPKWAHCESTTGKYSRVAEEMQQMIAPHLDTKQFFLEDQSIVLVLQHLFGSLQDETLMQTLLEREILTLPDEHVLNRGSFEKCLEHLTSLICPSSKQSLFMYLCIKRPVVIERVLFGLKLKIYHSEITEETMLLIFQYSIFMEHLVEYFCQQRSVDMKEYLARDLSYFLSNTMISAKAMSLQIPVLNCLLQFLPKVIPTSAEYFTTHLNFLTSALLSVHNQNTSEKLISKTLALLEMIIIEHQALFGDGIRKLNYFPENDRFNNLREALAKIKASGCESTFAESIAAIIQLPRLKYEELTTLRGLLVSRKDELVKLCEELKSSNGFSENCSQNILMRLINTLLDEIRVSTNDKSTVEALRCLGEIGPVDLSTMLLKTDAESEIYEKLENTASTVQQFIRVMVEELNQLIVHKNARVAEKATSVCYYVLQNAKYKGLAANLKTVFPYMALSVSDRQILKRSQGTTNLTAIIESLNDSFSYESFVSAVATALFDYLQDEVIKVLVDTEVTFATKLTPILIQVVLSFNDDGLREDITTFVNKYFDMFKTNDTSSKNLSSNLESVHLMLKIVECIRMYSQNYPQYKIELNYMPIASASLQCEAYFKAIMYCELWCMDQRSNGVDNDTIMSNPQLMNVMKNAYSAIGVDEAARAFLNPITSRSEYYRQEQKHNLCLLHYDISSCSKDTLEVSAYTEALKRSSLYSLANKVTNDVDFDCAWRLADWNVAVDGAIEESDETINWHQIFDKQHYKALKCLELKDEAATESAVFEGRKALSKMLKVASMESTKNIYPYLCKLRQLQQIEDFMNVHFYRVIDGEQGLIQKWNEQDKLPYSDFASMEVILSQRVAILKTARIRAMRKWVPDTLNQARFQLIHEARTTGHHDVAMANVCSMTRQSLSEDVKALVMLEDALLNWSVGDKFLSKKLVNEIVSGGKCKDLLVNAAAYRVYGTFLAETNAEDVHNIHKNFFNQSNALVEEALRQSSQQKKNSSADYQSKCLESDRNFIVLHTIAKYADREFIRLKNHFSSNDFKLRRTNLEKLKREVDMLDAEIHSLDETDKEKLSALKRARISAKQNAVRDEESMKTMVSNMEDYLKMALLYYSSYTRKTSVESDLAVFRIVALWLGNHSTGIVVNIKEALKVIPSYKFVPVLPQLAPRLDNSAEGVGQIIGEILERCAVDHPHHTLPHILAQVYAFADVESKDIPKDDARLLGAQSLYKKLSKNPKISHILNQMSTMNLAFIDLANKTLGSGRGFSSYKMSSRDTLKKCQDLDKVHCPTVELRVRENGIYDNIIGVHKWNDHIEGVGGINAPKKLVCHCMDGQDRVQLIKGKDDMRQDAVMLQVFSILNVLLGNDKDANRRKLRVRTYKVVPLSKQSGILEWCSDTITFGAWLVPAHEHYRPRDLRPTDARKAFAELAKSSLRTKQEKFLKICQRLSPVFQYYFLEKFLTPGKWFERRLCYTKSVAVSSMIGYILGIGDRHVQNLLVDEETAEIIHIDFGIAFELGKNLPTPETIPFRLSRDMVAGMGVSGIEGVFKKSCEKTLEILRNSHAPIMTILEVLLYDPLYSWNVLSNKKAVRKQRAEMYGDNAAAINTINEDTVNISAERALLRVSEKLNGKEDEKFTSVEGQVERLIFAASSNLNLCQLFQGWQPYL